MHFLSFAMAVLLSGCGTFQKMAIRSSGPMLEQGSDHLTKERNWDFFKDSSPANLKFLEMLYLQDTSNLRLLSVLIKGYAGYAYGVPETLAFGDELLGLDESIHKVNAIDFYTRSFDSGLHYLHHKNIHRQNLLSGDEKALTKLLKKNLDKDDLTALLYFAQSWGSLVNLQKDNIFLISQVPTIKVLFDWICDQRPDIENGVCDIFYAQYEASRPRMLGGNPAKAKELYLAAMKKRPQHLLIRLGYIQYLILPAFDQQAYEAEAATLKEEFAKWENLNRDTMLGKSGYEEVQHLNLFNAIAKKRFEMIEKNKNKIFEG
jgi:hypothetical protein